MSTTLIPPQGRRTLREGRHVGLPKRAEKEIVSAQGRLATTHLMVSLNPELADVN